MHKRRATAAPRWRAVGNRSPKARLAVVCEGAKTEPQYLKAAESHSSSTLLELVVIDEAATFT